MRNKVMLSMVISWAFFFCIALPQVFATERVELQPGEMPDAQGEVVIQDIGDGMKEVNITVQELRPDGVYTVWLVTERFLRGPEMAGLGDEPYGFQTDSQGQGSYTAEISAEELENWEEIKIAYHPDRDPGNMENIIIDLEADI